MNVGELREFLDRYGADDDVVVVAATLADGSVIGAQQLNVGTDQGGEDGEGIQVVIGWEDGTEYIERP